MVAEENSYTVLQIVKFVDTLIIYWSVNSKEPGQTTRWQRLITFGSNRVSVNGFRIYTRIKDFSFTQGKQLQKRIQIFNE